jgi:CRP-like cAMP-binding protein
MRSKRPNPASSSRPLPSAHSPRRNQILAALSDVALRRVAAAGEIVELAFGQTLYEQGKVERYVYFPMDAYLSQISALDDKTRIEVGLIGAEGMVGSSSLFGIELAPLHTVVQGAGGAVRVEAARFVKGLARDPGFRAVMNRYLYVRLTQLGQMIVCVRFHTVEQRLARWLLMTRDRAGSDSFQLTHEYLAMMLGVRRVGITQAATYLQNQKLIRYHRGSITIVNGPELLATSCDCYAAAERTYAQHMI